MTLRDLLFCLALATSFGLVLSAAKTVAQGAVTCDKALAAVGTEGDQQ
jgi:hypothetical protein